MNEDMATVKFLDNTFRNFKGIGDELGRYCKGINNKELGETIEDIMLKIGGIVRELNRATAIARSVAMNREVSFISSDREAMESLSIAGELIGKIPAKDEFKVGDKIDPQGKTNMVGVVEVVGIVGNGIKFKDAEGKEYAAMQRSQVRRLIDGGAWKRVEKK